MVHKYEGKAMIVFEDPKRVAPLGSENMIYPNGEFMPEDGARRGSLQGSLSYILLFSFIVLIVLFKFLTKYFKHRMVTFSHQTIHPQVNLLNLFITDKFFIFLIL